MTILQVRNWVPLFFRNHFNLEHRKSELLDSEPKIICLKQTKIRTPKTVRTVISLSEIVSYCTSKSSLNEITETQTNSDLDITSQEPPLTKLLSISKKNRS